MSYMQMRQGQQLMLKILWESVMNGVFFLFIVVFPDLVEVLTDPDSDGLRDLFFFEDFVEGWPALVVLSGGLLDLFDDAPDCVDE